MDESNIARTNLLKKAVCSITLPELVLGFIKQEFRVKTVACSEVYRRIGAKISLNRKIIRTCLLVLSEAKAVQFIGIGKEPYIKINW